MAKHKNFYQNWPSNQERQNQPNTYTSNILCIICLMTLYQGDLSDKVLQVFFCKLGDKLPPGPLYTQALCKFLKLAITSLHVLHPLFVYLHILKLWGVSHLSQQWHHLVLGVIVGIWRVAGNLDPQPHIGQCQPEKFMKLNSIWNWSTPTWNASWWDHIG